MLSDVDHIKDATDIVQLISQSVDLKKRGASYKGLCPFHTEKTPSFTVSATKQTYHCFGCGAHGDALQWLMETEGKDFLGALRQLAGDAGIQLPERSSERHPLRETQKQIYSLNKAAGDQYVQALHAQQGAIARRYLNERGVTEQSISAFSLGWADAELPTDIGRTEALLHAGLVSQNENGSGTRPFFYKRLMFPIRDRRGDVIGFGGRTLRDIQPKYLNTGVTEVFDKSWTLYGVFEAQASIRRLNHVVVVEGYLDTILMHQNGFTQTVATCGTAITDQHLRMLLSMADRITFALDGDRAGKSATRRAIEKLLPLIEDRHCVDFARLPPGDDPDSFVRTNGAAAMQTLLSTARPLSAVIMHWFTPPPSTSLEEKVHLARTAEEFLGPFGHAPKMRELLIHEISSRIGLTISPHPPKERRSGSSLAERPSGVPLEKPVSEKPLVQTQESPIVLQRVVYPVLRMLIAFPRCKSVMPPELRSIPFIASAIEVIDQSPNADPAHWAARKDVPVLRALNDLFLSAIQRRDMTSPEHADVDVQRVFETATRTLQRLRPGIGA